MGGQPSPQQAAIARGDADSSQLEQTGRPVLKTSEDYVGYVTRLHADMQAVRYPYEPTWFLDMANYLGQQWTVWGGADRPLRNANAPSHRIRLTINKIQPTIKTLMGKVLRGIPRLIGSPTDTTDRSRALARVSERLLRALWDHCHMYNVQQDAYLWAFCTGTGWFDVGWDPSLGEWVLDDEGRPMATGDISVAALSPYAVWAPRWVTDPSRPSVMLQGGLYPTEQVRIQFPETAKELKPYGTLAEVSTYDERMQSLISPLSSYGSPMHQNEPVNMVLRLWEDPQTLTPWEREDFPRGRLTVVADSRELLFVGNNPFADAKHPLVRVRGGVMPGRLWGTSVVENLIPLQRAINKGRSQMAEARNLTAAPQILAPKGHQCPKQTNQPGSWLEYTSGLKPEYMSPPPMNQWLVEDLDRLATEFQDVAQVREVSQGTLPAANLTGVGISLLQEADNTPWGPIASEFALALGEVGQKMIARAYQGYTEPRIFTALDELDDDDVLEFFSSGELAPVKVRCDVTSVMPESKAARMARVEALLNLRVLDPIRDRSTILRLMEFGSVESLWLDTDADVRRAMRENRRMAKGQPVPIATFDDHEIHVREHDTFRKSTEYESLDPLGQLIFNLHVEEHLMAIAQLKAAMIPAPTSPAVGGASGSSGNPPGAAGSQAPSSTGLGEF